MSWGPVDVEGCCNSFFIFNFCNGIFYNRDDLVHFPHDLVLITRTKLAGNVGLPQTSETIVNEMKITTTKLTYIATKTGQRPI